jgi:hypothetical protein
MILWWVRIFNDFEVNSKEAINPLASHIFSHDFFFTQAIGKITCYRKGYETVYSVVPQFGAHTRVYQH